MESEPDSALVALVKRYRALHKECRLVTWAPDTKGYNDITADGRCPLCKKADALCGDAAEVAAELKR